MLRASPAQIEIHSHLRIDRNTAIPCCFPNSKAFTPIEKTFIFQERVQTSTFALSGMSYGGSIRDQRADAREQRRAVGETSV
jgi:hypothetical protein